MKDKNVKYIDIFYKKLKKHWYKVILSILSGLVRSILMLLPTMMLQEIINGISDNISFNEIYARGVLYVALPTIVLVLYIIDTRMSKFVFDIIRDIRTDGIDNMLHQPVSWMQKNSEQALYNKIIQATQKLADFYFSTLSNFIWYTSTIIAGCFLMLKIDVFISAILIIISFIQLTVLTIRKKYTKKIEDKFNDVSIQWNSIVNETIENNSYIKLLGLSGNVENTKGIWKSEFLKSISMRIKNDIFSNSTASVCELARIVLLLIFSQIAFMKSNIKIGDIYALNSYIAWLTPVFFGMQRWIISYFSAKSNQDRIEEVLLLKRKIETKTLVANEIKTLEFSDVCFRYSDEENFILNHINFKLNQDGVLFIFGPSGCGKSTITKLLLKLEKPVTGKISINDKSIDLYNDEWFSSNIIGATQGTELIEMSLKDNLNYSGCASSEDEIYKVLQSLDMQERVLNLKEGLDTIISRDVVIFSDGERKRLGIARVMLSGAKLMVFDEPTAGLDNITKQHVMAALRKRAKFNMAIIITHDKSILEESDSVIYLGA